MDQIATSAGVASALEFCMSLCSRTDAIIESWHSTPPLMFALHNELSDLVVVLDSARAAAETAVLDNGKQHTEFFSELKQPLTEAFRLLTVVEDLTAKLLEARDGRARGSVLSKDGKTATFKNRLRDVRIALDDCLLLHNVYGYHTCSHPGRS